MRKILLASTAIASTFAVASAQAEVSISGGVTMQYYSINDDVTSRTSDQTMSMTDNTVSISFSSVTDSGLALSYSTTIDMSDTKNASISGDFGTIAMSNTGHAAEAFDVTSGGVIGGHGDLQTNKLDDSGVAITGVRFNEASIAADITTQAINYYSPSINGFTFGVGISEIEADSQETSMGAMYSASMGDVSYSIGYAAVDGDSVEEEGSHVGLNITMGDISLGLGMSDNQASASAKEETTSYSVTYAMSDALTLNVGHVSSSDDTASTTLDATNTTIAAAYTIADGLVASLASHSFDYKEAGAANNDGSVMQFMINMSF
jgi:hypothetical protein